MQSVIRCSCAAAATKQQLRPMLRLSILRSRSRNLATIADVPLQDGRAPAVASTSSSQPVSTKPQPISIAESIEAAERRGRRQRPIVEARRAPQPVRAENADKAQQIYLPNIIIRLVRNGPAEKHNPYIATFRVPVQLTKPDIVSYLAQVYGLKVTSISTVVEMGDTVRTQVGKWKSKGRDQATKKAIVGMEQPFWYPDKRSDEWLDQYFEKNARKNFLRKRLLPLGDGGPGRGRRSWRWRGADPQIQGLGARYSQIIKRIQEKRTQQEAMVKQLTEQERVSFMSSIAPVQGHPMA